MAGLSIGNWSQIYVTFNTAVTKDVNAFQKPETVNIKCSDHCCIKLKYEFWSYNISSIEHWSFPKFKFIKYRKIMHRLY